MSTIFIYSFCRKGINGKRPLNRLINLESERKLIDSVLQLHAENDSTTVIAIESDITQLLGKDIKLDGES